MPFEPDAHFCVGFWDLNHNGYYAKDSSGFGNHGRWHSDVRLKEGISNGFETTLYADGDGVYRFVLVPDSTLLQLTQSQVGFSIFCRIYPRDLTQTDSLVEPIYEYIYTGGSVTSRSFTSASFSYPSNTVVNILGYTGIRKFRHILAKNDDYNESDSDGTVTHGYAWALTDDGRLRFTLRRDNHNYTVETLPNTIVITDPPTAYDIAVVCSVSTAPIVIEPPPPPADEPPIGDEPVPPPSPPPQIDPTKITHKFIYSSSANITSEGNDGNIDDNVNDSNLKTRWSYRPIPAWIKIDLGARKTVELVKIAWYRGNDRRMDFNIKTADVDEQYPYLPYTSYTQRYKGRSSGATSGLETYNVADSNARYVLINVTGNSDNDYASITEIEIHGKEIPNIVEPPPTPPSQPPIPPSTPQDPQLELYVDRVAYAMKTTDHLPIPEDPNRELMIYGNYPHSDSYDALRYYKFKGGIQHLIMYKDFRFAPQHIENIWRNKITIADIELGRVALAGLCAIFEGLEGPGGFSTQGFSDVGFDIGYDEMTIGADFGGFDPIGFDPIGFDTVAESTAKD